MLVNDIVVIARRILGDTCATGWSNPRMLDIVNSGLRDINKIVGAYRSEYFFELQQYRYRYALPTDLLKVTSLWHNGLPVDLVNQRDTTKGLAATKDQLNVGVLELKNIPIVEARDKRFVGGPTGFLVPQPDFDLWKDSVWNNTSVWRDNQVWGEPYSVIEDEVGVVANPLLNPLGITAGAELPAEIYDNLQPTVRGLLSDVREIGVSTPISMSGDSFEVLTAFDPQGTSALDNGGTVGALNGLPYRIAGKYGTVVSVLKPEECVHVRYKALPQELTSLEAAFPMSPSWIEAMVNWIVGTALQDDNDANNAQRAIVFLQRYTRDIESELEASNTDYSTAGKKYKTKYNGRIQ